jgi:hypothetical protein
MSDSTYGTVTEPSGLSTAYLLRSKEIPAGVWEQIGGRGTRQYARRASILSCGTPGDLWRARIRMPRSAWQVLRTSICAHFLAANRTHPLKEGTFVLDFVNDREEIQNALETYYEGAAMGEEVAPAWLYPIKSELDASGIYLAAEVERFTAIYFKPKQRQSMQDRQAMNAALDPPVWVYIRALLGFLPDPRRATAKLVSATRPGLACYRCLGFPRFLSWRPPV